MFGDTVLITNILEICKVRNEGIAFGVNQKNLSNIVLTVVVLCFIIRFVISQKDNLEYKNMFFIGMMLAGGISNLIDRIFRGAVFDFIKISSFPIFNLADCFITLRMDFICNKFNKIFS